MNSSTFCFLHLTGVHLWWIDFKSLDMIYKGAQLPIKIFLWLILSCVNPKNSKIFLIFLWTNLKRFKSFKSRLHTQQSSQIQNGKKEHPKCLLNKALCVVQEQMQKGQIWLAVCHQSRLFCYQCKRKLSIHSKKTQKPVIAKCHSKPGTPCFLYPLRFIVDTLAHFLSNTAKNTAKILKRNCCVAFLLLVWSRYCHITTQRIG